MICSLVDNLTNISKNKAIYDLNWKRPNGAHTVYEMQCVIHELFVIPNSLKGALRVEVLNSLFILDDLLQARN